MSANILLRQDATAQILQNVSRYCAECYEEFNQKEPLYYDMERYCYLCSRCAEQLVERIEEDSKEIEEDKGPTLFT